ncbi:hypothetical protein ACHQM5_022945 [Ranunculus cassubicifolius]
MEPQYDQQENSKNNCVAGSRQASTRWTPTSEQIRILKELYNDNGVRSPSAEQIQRITAALRQYGKIEGKNVFYWFQNHKARERHKRRSTSDTTMPMHQRPAPPPPTPSPHRQHFHGASSSTCSGLTTVGKIRSSNMRYGSIVMEKSLSDCSTYAGGAGTNMGESMKNNFSWVANGGDPYPFLDRTNYETLETLPLFPMHGEQEEDDDSGIGSYTGNPNPNGAWFGSEDGWIHGSRTSLELSLKTFPFN